MDEEILEAINDSFEALEKLIDQRTWAIRQMIDAQNRLLVSLAFHVAPNSAPDYADRLDKSMNDAKDTWLGRGYLYEEEEK